VHARQVTEGHPSPPDAEPQDSAGARRLGLFFTPETSERRKYLARYVAAAVAIAAVICLLAVVSVALR
jgi:hypothetical protein